MGINYLPTSTGACRISELSTVFPFISWFDQWPNPLHNVYGTPIPISGGSGSVDGHCFKPPLIVTFWMFSSQQKRRKGTMDFFASNLPTLSNHSAHTGFIKVLNFGSNLVNLDFFNPHLMPFFVSGSFSRSAVVITKISISKAADTGIIRRGQRSDWIGGCSCRLVGHPKTWYPTRVSMEVIVTSW